jgi:hypothetical protein
MQHGDRQENIRNESDNNKHLNPGGLLDILLCFHIADFAGAVLSLFFKEHRIEFASQTDTKRRFKEQEY